MAIPSKSIEENLSNPVTHAIKGKIIIFGIHKLNALLKLQKHKKEASDKHKDHVGTKPHQEGIDSNPPFTSRTFNHPHVL